MTQGNRKHIEYVRWQSSYSVGNEKLDNQHKKIIEFLNTLYWTLREGMQRQVLLSILDELNDYTLTHLREEEELLKACNYPDYETHWGMHEKLKARTFRFRKRFQYDYQAEFVSDFFEFLKEWWIAHITQVDKKYEPYLKKSDMTQSDNTRSQ